MCYYNTHTPIAQLFFYFIHLGYRATSQSARYTASALDTCQKSFCWVSRVYTRPPFFYLCLYKCMLLFVFLKEGAPFIGRWKDLFTFLCAIIQMRLFFLCWNMERMFDSNVCVFNIRAGKREWITFLIPFWFFRFFVFLSNRPMTNDWQLPVYAALLAAVCGKKLIQRRLFFFFCFRVPPHVVNFQPVGVVSFFIRKRKKTGSIYNDRKSVGTLAFVIPTGSL